MLILNTLAQHESKIKVSKIKVSACHPCELARLMLTEKSVPTIKGNAEES